MWKYETNSDELGSGEASVDKGAVNKPPWHSSSLTSEKHT